MRERTPPWEHRFMDRTSQLVSAYSYSQDKTICRIVRIECSQPISLTDMGIIFREDDSLREPALLSDHTQLSPTS